MKKKSDDHEAIVNNTAALYLLNIVKMLLPLVTLPYLTRVLSKDCYGAVAYVKAVMQYLQLLVDYGFLLSGTKDIVDSKEGISNLNRQNNMIFTARIIMGIFAGSVVAISIQILPILKEYSVYTWLSYIPVFLTCFLFDYLFRGLEKMHIITMRFVIMKFLSTVLTFMWVRTDEDILLMPIFDSLGTIVAIGLILAELKKIDVQIKLVSIKSAMGKIKQATLYFISDVATTAFSAFNILFIGIYMDKEQVANWSICIQMIAAVQSMYTPIMNGIYPTMVRNKDARLIKNVLRFFMPIVMLGSIFTLIVAKPVIVLVGGLQYIGAENVLRCLVPVLVFSFPAMLFGWPTLGAINKVKEVTASTILAAMIQIVGVSLLILVQRMTLINIALVRGVSELTLFGFRYFFYKKNITIFMTKI